MTYTNISQTLEALTRGKVDVVILDAFSLKTALSVLKKNSLKVGTIIDTSSGYGFVISGLSSALIYDFESQLLAAKSEISEIVSSMKPDLSVRNYFDND